VRTSTIGSLGGKILQGLNSQTSSSETLETLRNQQANRAKRILTKGMKNEIQQILKYKPTQYPKLIDSL